MVRAIAEAEPTSIERAAHELGQSRRLLAPVAWAAGTIVLLLRGIKLLIFNWRLSLIQVVPAAWIWLAMWDLKQHALRGSPFRSLTPGGMVLLSLLAIAVSIAAFWCNTVFAFAIDGPPPPRVRPAVQRARGHLGKVIGAGVLVGSALAFAVAVVPRLDNLLLFILVLGGVLGLMLISFVAVPARIIGTNTRRKPRLAARQAVGKAAAEGALSAVAMTPGFVLDRVGLLLLGTRLNLLGFLLLSLGSALYAAGMSSVKAVKLSTKLSRD